MHEPRLDRPDMPDGYGVPTDTEGMVPWADVDERLTRARVFWLSTTRPDGRPHVVPRWGAWVDGALYYDGSPETRHVRNLRDNPSCALHLEDGTNAVILEGASGPSEPPGPELGARISTSFRRKYEEAGYAPEPDAWEGSGAGGLRRFLPSKAMAWRQFPTDVTRYRFG
jgi:hypothetical protein